MELRVLRYFLTVAREESITKAAELLYITQLTLSRQIAELEQEMGTVLFIRSNRNVTLTDAGRLFRRRVEVFCEYSGSATIERTAAAYEVTTS